MGRGLLLISMLLLHNAARAAEVTCLVADFKALVDTPPTQREATAFRWISTTGKDCSYEQLEAINNNLGSWLGTAHSSRVSTAIARQLEAYYVAKNEWNDDLYTSREAFVSPYDASKRSAATNTIAPPDYQDSYQFGQPQSQLSLPFDRDLKNSQQSYQPSENRFLREPNQNEISDQISTTQKPIGDLTPFSDQ